MAKFRQKVKDQTILDHFWDWKKVPNMAKFRQKVKGLTLTICPIFEHFWDFWKKHTKIASLGLKKRF